MQFSLERLHRSFIENRGVTLAPESRACLRAVDKQFRPLLRLVPLSRKATRQAIQLLCFLAAALYRQQRAAGIEGRQARALAHDLVVCIRSALQDGLRIMTWSEDDFRVEMDRLVDWILIGREDTLAARLARLYRV
jgi:hypothetical protein